MLPCSAVCQATAAIPAVGVEPAGKAQRSLGRPGEGFESLGRPLRAYQLTLLKIVWSDIRRIAGPDLRYAPPWLLRVRYIPPKGGHLDFVHILFQATCNTDEVKAIKPSTANLEDGQFVAPPGLAQFFRCLVDTSLIT